MCFWVIKPRKQNRVSSRAIHRDNNSFSPDEFLIKPEHHLSHKLSDVPNFCQVSLSSMHKYNLKNIAILLKASLVDDRDYIYCQWYSLALNIPESKIF